MQENIPTKARPPLINIFGSDTDFPKRPERSGFYVNPITDFTYSADFLNANFATIAYVNNHVPMGDFATTSTLSAAVAPLATTAYVNATFPTFAFVNGLSGGVILGEPSTLAYYNSNGNIDNLTDYAVNTLGGLSASLTLALPDAGETTVTVGTQITIAPTEDWAQRGVVGEQFSMTLPAGFGAHSVAGVSTSMQINANAADISLESIYIGLGDGSTAASSDSYNTRNLYLEVGSQYTANGGIQHDQLFTRVDEGATVDRVLFAGYAATIDGVVTHNLAAVQFTPTVSSTGRINSAAALFSNVTSDAAYDNYEGVGVYGNGLVGPNRVCGLNVNINYTTPANTVYGLQMSAASGTQTVGIQCNAGPTPQFIGMALGASAPVAQFLGSQMTPTGDGTGSFVGMQTLGNNWQNYTGCHINPGGAITDTLNAFHVAYFGSGAHFRGLRVELGSGTFSSDVVAVDVNVSGALSGGRAQGLSVNADQNGISANATLVSNAGFDGGNLIGGTYTIPEAGGTGTAVIFNNFATNMIALGDMDGGIANIGYVHVGFVGQAIVASGKAVDRMSLCLAGFQYPAVDGITNSGTVADVAMFRTFAPLNGGGSLAITDLHGLRVEAGFKSIATSAWGVRVDDTGSDNYFAKSITVGGATAQTASPDVAIDITGQKVVQLARMTTTEIGAIATPAEGMLTFDTTLKKLTYYDGATWVAL